MIPKRREWLRWDTMEKATYVAQILAPFALLVTVFFSYLSWHEARRALQIQERVFSAQSSPRLQLSRAETGLMDEGRSIGFTLKNFGESDARNVCARIYYEFRPLRDGCVGSLGGDARPAETIARDETYAFLLNLSPPDFEPVGFVPTSAHIVDEDSRVVGCEEGEAVSIIGISYTYENVLGADLIGGDQVMLCGPG